MLNFKKNKQELNNNGMKYKNIQIQKQQYILLEKGIYIIYYFK